MLKIQTCVLRVNVHCDGCKHKIKKKLQKIEEVCEVIIDVEQGKVTVSGNVDPAILIKKLDKAGKHAELWGPQKPPTSTTNMHIGKDSTRQNGGFQSTRHKNELRDVRFWGKDQKSVKLRLPQQEEDDDSDEDDDQLDDEFDQGFAARHQPPTKGHGPQANSATPNAHPKGKTGSNNGGKSKKGSRMDMFFKGILGKAGGKSGGPSLRKTQNKAVNQDGCGKTSYKNGAVSGNGASAAHKNYNDSWSKKVGEKFDASRKLEDQQMQQGFNEINTRHRGGGGSGKTVPMGQVGNFWGGNTGPMGGQMGNFWGGNTGPVGGQMGNFRGGIAGSMGGQMGNFEAVQGLQPEAAMSVGNFQGNPHYQQYMAHMMIMNQQRDDSYLRSQPATSYGPPPMADQYTHIFNDENTSSCSIM